MTTYARITATGDFERTIDLTDEQFAALQVNGKAAFLRLYFIDPQPVPSATQVVEPEIVKVTATEARQSWRLRDKSQAELDADQNAAEAPTLRALLNAINADITAYNAAPDVTGTAVERLTKLEARVRDIERQQRRTNLILRHYARALT